VANDCHAGNGSFRYDGTAFSGIATNCSAGDNSFGYWGTFSGTTINCVAGANSFGSLGTLSGEARNCVGGSESFGGGAILPYTTGSVTSSGRVVHCQISGTGGFSIPQSGGKIVNSTDGDGRIINFGVPPSGDIAMGEFE
jgi:hypothetical protein